MKKKVILSLLPGFLLAAPIAPSNLTLKAISKTSVSIDWGDNDKLESGYKIFRNEKLIAITGENVHHFIDTNLTPNTAYKYTIKATDDQYLDKIFDNSRMVYNSSNQPESDDFLKTYLTEQTNNQENNILLAKDLNNYVSKNIDQNYMNSYLVYLAKQTASFDAGILNGKQIQPYVYLWKSKKDMLTIGSDYTEQGIEAYGINADLTNLITKTNIDTFQTGSQTITYTIPYGDGKTITKTREIFVNPLDAGLAKDTNTYFAKAGEDGYLYFSDPQESEDGKNRAIRVDYKNMSFNEDVDAVTASNKFLMAGKVASNPHSIDRAGDTDKFYVRTQNALSFDVMSFKEGKVLKTVPLEVTINGTKVPFGPRAFGAYNKKYNIQLISGRNIKNHSVVGVIHVPSDTLITSFAEPVNAGTTVTGHAKWLDDDHFVMIDRGNKKLVVYECILKSKTMGIPDLEIQKIQDFSLGVMVHALERNRNPQNKEDLTSFYVLGQGYKIGDKKYPYAMKIKFDSQTGLLSHVIDENGKNLTTVFTKTEIPYLKEQHVKVMTHHGSITPDGRYFVVPAYDGKVYKLDNNTMQIVAEVDTNSGENKGKGLGAAHVEFSESLNLAIITNHWSNYVTIIDMNNFTVKKQLLIYSDATTFTHNPEKMRLMQPHFAHVGEEGKYYYTFAIEDKGNPDDPNDDGSRFIKINLETLEIEKTIFVGGAPGQSHS